jgi:hypothetical protein
MHNQGKREDLPLMCMTGKLYIEFPDAAGLDSGLMFQKYVKPLW